MGTSIKKAVSAFASGTVLLVLALSCSAFIHGEYAHASTAKGTNEYVAANSAASGATALANKASVAGGAAPLKAGGLHEVEAADSESVEAGEGTEAEEVKPVIANGTYTLVSKFGATRWAISTGSAQRGQGARIVMERSNDVLTQRFKLKHLGGDVYSIQATSGRYLTERENTVVQTARQKSGELLKRQQWVVTAQNGRVSFTNAESGKLMCVTEKASGDGAKLVMSDCEALTATRFTATRAKRLIPKDMYTFNIRDRSQYLDVTGASWDVGANVRLWPASGDISQKFFVKPKGGGNYEITMALSGRPIVAIAASGEKANVRLGSSTDGSALLWKPRISDNGIEFVNVGTGGVLGSVGDKAKKGANVRTSKANSKPTQAWQLSKTKVTKANVRSFHNLCAIVSHAPSGGNHTVKVSAKNSGYKMSSAVKARLKSALGAAWKRGEDVSFMMVDLNTGVTISSGADRSNHGASTFKAAYVTYLFQNVRERGHEVDGNTKWLMAQTIGSSSNEAYLSLRNRFGTSGFRTWLRDVGLSNLASDPYPRLTARKLALVWSKIYSYERSGGRYVGEWRKMFNHSYYSCIREALAGSNTVYSKPGWYPKSGGYAALNDAAIVKDRKGGAYLLTILSNTACYSEQWIIRDVTKAIDAAQDKIS